MTTTTKKLVTEIDENEIAIRIAEACIGLRRPLGMTAAEFVAKLCKGTKNNPSDLITRIEYEYI